MKKLKVLVVPSDRTGVSYYRSTTPHLALEEFFPDEFHVDIDYEPKLDDDNWLKQYDIIHYHRTLGAYEKIGMLLEKFDKLGIISIMDIDDYWAPGMHHPAYHLIRGNSLDIKIKNNISLARNVTTTTPIFAEEIRKINKNVFVLPNAINENEEQFKIKPQTSKRLRIGWLGGSSHLHDLKLLNGLVSKLDSAGLLDKIQFVLCGFDLRGVHTYIDPITKETKSRNIEPKESVWYEYERIFTDDYKSISPEYKKHLLSFEQKEFDKIDDEPYRRVWTKPITSYASSYNLFDVSLAPLEENTFNKVKSQLKVIEAGFHKKAIIAQNFGPYQLDLSNAIKFGGEIDNQANAILINSKVNHKGWFEAIKKLVNNPELVTVLQNNLYETVKEKYNLKTVSSTRRNLYQELYKNKNGKP